MGSYFSEIEIYACIFVGITLFFLCCRFQLNILLFPLVRATRLNILVQIEETICVLFTAEFPMIGEHNLNEGSSPSARIKYNYFHFCSCSSVFIVWSL